MGSAGVILSSKLCPELGPRLAAMTWSEIETMIKQFIAEDDCQRVPWAEKQIILRAKARDYKTDPIKFLSDLVHDLEKPGIEIKCEARGIDLRMTTKEKLSFYRGAKTPAIA